MLVLRRSSTKCLTLHLAERKRLHILVIEYLPYISLGLLPLGLALVGLVRSSPRVDQGVVVPVLGCPSMDRHSHELVEVVLVRDI
jgi:hypothetical protein